MTTIENNHVARNPKFLSLSCDKLHALTMPGGFWPLSGTVRWVAGTKKARRELLSMVQAFLNPSLWNPQDADAFLKVWHERAQEWI